MPIPPTPRRRTTGTGAIITAALVVGLVAGIAAGQPTIGFLAGLGAGIVIALAIWLNERAR